MILVDYALETFIFREPVQLFYTDGSKPLSMEVKTMEDVADLLDYINDNEFQPGIGGFSIELQLWFALARRAKFFKQE
jgi:hypothetical protein